MIAALNVADRIRKEEISKQEIYSDFADIFDKSTNLLRHFQIGDSYGKIGEFDHPRAFGSDGYRNFKITRTLDVET